MVASLAHYRIFPLRKPTEPFFRKLCAHRLQEDAEDIDFFSKTVIAFPQIVSVGPRSLLVCHVTFYPQWEGAGSVFWEQVIG